jgi:hypothetical protein
MAALNANALRFIDSVTTRFTTQMGREIEAMPAEDIKAAMVYLCGWRPGFAERFLEYAADIPPEHGGHWNAHRQPDATTYDVSPCASPAP